MARPAWNRYARLAVKTGVAILVLAFVGRHVARTWNDLRQPGRSLHVEPAWAAAGGLLYIAGLAAFGMFFAAILKSSRTPVHAAAAVRAYIISHLGKYVPGKAMVVVMRVGMVVPHGARPASAALATFYETLVMMAAGALVAALGFGWGPLSASAPRRLPLGMALGLAGAFLVVVEPRVFPRIAKLATMPFPRLGAEAMPAFTYRLLGVGLAWSTAGWALLGMSQAAVIRAVSPAGVAPGLWPIVTASVALATVAGFVVAVTPGGLGVREGALIVFLTPVLGHDPAVVAALALRLVWIVAEILAAAALAVARPAAPESAPAPAPAPAPLSMPGGEGP